MPCSARAAAAAVLAVAARRRLSGLPRIVAPAVPGVDDPLGARGDPTTVQRWSAVSGGGLFECEDDPAERVLLLATACEPNVVVAHLLAGAGSKRLAAFHNELAGAGLLGLQLGQERRVGRELVAGQARIALLTQLARRQQAPAVGQDPIGAFVQLQHVVDLARIARQVTRVGGDLAEAPTPSFVAL